MAAIRIREFRLDQLSPKDVEFVKQIQSAIQLPIISAQRFEGMVSKVADGDSFVVRVDGQEVEIRMHGIDAPDHGQPFSKEAGQILRSMIQSQRVQLEELDIDKYGRKVCRVYLEESLINAYLVEIGAAWHYQAFSDDPKLAQLQRQAQRQRVGIWSQPNPVAPWEWRTAHPRVNRK